MVREWHLVRRPRAHASPDDFALVERDIPAPAVRRRRLERFSEVLLGQLRGGTPTTGKAVIRVEDEA